MPTLILTPRFTEDSQALWRATSQLGWAVERLATWRVPDHLLGVPDPVLYVESLFGPSIAEQLGLELLEPDADWLPRLPEEFRKRKMSLTTLRVARSLTEPAFIKPPNDKSFPAKVYSGAELPQGYDESSPVLVSEIVTWESEFRCFVLDREPKTLSIYARYGELQSENLYAMTEQENTEALFFIKLLLADPRVDFPRATVLDVGIIAGRGWAAVEQNAAWGSGIYGCDPLRVLNVLRHAVTPIARGR